MGNLSFSAHPSLNLTVPKIYERTQQRHAAIVRTIRVRVLRGFLRKTLRWGACALFR